MPQTSFQEPATVPGLMGLVFAGIMTASGHRAAERVVRREARDR